MATDNDKQKGVVDISEARPDPELRRERFRNYRKSDMAASEQFGNVIARVYANETHAGEVVFKVEAVRIYTMSNGSGEAFSFEFRDIPDAIRGLKWAMSWIWRVERERRRQQRYWR